MPGDPMAIGPQDTQLLLVAGGVYAATQNFAALDLGAGFAPAGGGVPMLAIISIASLKRSVGDEIYTYTVQDSPDNVTFISRSPGRTNVDEGLTVNNVGGVIALGAFIRNRYVRIALTEAGTAPTTTLNAIYLQPKVNDVG
jgi:hypothetical protein